MTLLFLIGVVIFIIVLVFVCTWICEKKEVCATKLKPLQQTSMMRQSAMAASSKIRCWWHSVLALSAI
jgi:hypothetical protein